MTKDRWRRLVPTGLGRLHDSHASGPSGGATWIAPAALVAALALLSGLVLASLRGTRLQIGALIAIFAVAGLLTIRDTFKGYRAFVFLYPLLPSVPEQIGLPAFQYPSFLFLIFAFWWTAEKLRSDSSLRIGRLACPIGAFALYSFASCLLALLRTELLSSSVFLLKLLDRLDLSSVSSWRDGLSPMSALLSWMEGIYFLVITIDTLRTREHLRRLLRALLASALTVSILGILQYAFRFRPLALWMQENPNLLRTNSTWDDPNALGTYLAGMLILASAMWLFGEGRRRQLHLAAALPIAVALALTASRAAIGAACLAIVFLAVGRMRVVETSTRRCLTWIGSWAILTAAGLLVLVLLAGAADQRNPKPGTLGELLLFTFNPNIEPDVVLKGRLVLWQRALEIFGEHPVLGCGIGNLLGATARHLPLSADPAVIIENAHNQYLQVLAEIGLAGTILLFLLVCTILAPGFSLLFRVSARTDLAWTSGFLTGVLGILLTAITGHPLLLLKGQLLFWSMMGALWAATELASPAPPGRRSPWWPRIAVAASVALTVLFAIEAVSILRTRRVFPYEHGFYAWERETSERPFRWTGAEARALLEVEGDLLSLSLRQLNPAMARRSMRAEIELDGRLVDIITFRDSEWKELTYYLLGWEAKRTVLVTVRACETFVPRLVGMGADSRDLGLVIGSIRSECCFATAAGATVEAAPGGRTIRWLSYQVSFPVERNGNTLLVPVLLAMTRGMQQLEFYWDGDSIQTQSVEGDGWHACRLTLPNRGAVRGVLTIRRRPVSCREPLAAAPGAEGRLGVGDFSWEDPWR